MPEPELHVRDLTPPRPVVLCDSGRHVAHPGETCAEFDDLQAAFRAYFEQCLAAACAVTGRLLITGNGTGEMRGFLPAEPARGPTPMERALGILDPHLRACPLYKGGPPTLPPHWKA